MMPFGSIAGARPATPVPATGNAPVMPGAGAAMSQAEMLKILQQLTGAASTPGETSNFAGLIPLLMGKAKPGGMMGGLLDMMKQPQAPVGLPMNIGPAFGQPAADSTFTGGLGGRY